MILIDGGYGEGGGQILRTAVALSVLTGKSIRISNIRANRSNPGIRPQHFAAVKIIGDICNADIEGLEVGSHSFSFTPNEIKGGYYCFDVGTAGSIVLVFQTIILSLLNFPSEIKIRLMGGTDVKWAPGWDYFNSVFLKNLRRLGIIVDTRLIGRGYYPKGGGEAEIVLKSIGKILPFNCNSGLDFKNVEGVVHLCNLPDHVGTRMKLAAVKNLVNMELDHSIKIDKCKGLSAGCGITLWSESKGFVLGCLGLGERGIPADHIGKVTSEMILDEILSGSCIDVFSFDQLLAYMTMGKNASRCYVRNISNHAYTNMWVISQFFKDRNIFTIEEKNDNKIIMIHGVG